MVIFLYEKSHNKYYVIIKEQFLISERFFMANSNKSIIFV